MGDTLRITLSMSHLTPIYDAWDGNAEALASDIGESGVTVRQWRNRGNIPARYWQRIIDAAERRGKPIELRDFLPPAPQAAPDETSARAA